MAQEVREAVDDHGDKEQKLSVPAGEHGLETSWTLYFDRKLPTKNAGFDAFEKNLNKLGTATTVESFWRIFSHLTSPNELPVDTNYYMFRRNHIPAWESFPRGGCWIIRVKKRNGVINRLWEELLFSCIGELFEEPELVGVALSARARDDLISVWNKDNDAKPDAGQKIGELLKSILNLDESTVMEYKVFSSSLRDGSTFRNAKPFTFVPSPAVGATAPSAATEPAPLSLI